MRLLFVHSDHLSFETTTEATPDAETEGVPTAGELDDCLTTFISVETGDVSDPESVVTNAANELRDVAEQLNTRKVVLYPYAHLSDDLAPPDVAKSVLQGMEDELAGDFEVLRAPFGWYKSFELHCKGHPLSELSRHVTPGRPDDDDELREPSEWFLLTPGGDLQDPHDAADDLSADMQAFVAAEVDGETANPGQEPPHLELMREKSIADHDDLSDVGNLRYYPKGKLIRDALMAYVSDRVVDYGGMPVETPVMYDLGARCVREHSEKFGERQYRFESGNREMMLRFAACFGQFSVMRDMHIADADLPLRLYEMSTYSFRREQHGEVQGLKRLRAFTMPDMHTAAADIEGAKTEFAAQARLALDASHDLGLDYVAAMRVTREFYDANEDWVHDLVADLDQSVLLEVLPDRHHYWSAKIDFAAIDGLGRPIENPTVQIDVESAERFEITYTDDEGAHYPTLLHFSPSGGIERVMAALLEQAATMDRPRLPTWLSPTQVRFVPVREEHRHHCEALADDLDAAGIRVDIDDRTGESVGKRVSKAERDWVPYYAVVGDREVDADTLKVAVRETGAEAELTPPELEQRVAAEIDGLPRVRRYLPRRLSRRPQFPGN
ncbi:threonine--tRNA ligase [Haloarchaeobius sp. DFWS5]|uniref:threonine--tRNA ligase n=1 Tax=Haloarchaeobius sp. DFWS5 TaxID=3446114 RepID=UPI003EBD1EEA